MLDPIVFGAFRNSHLLSGREQAVKPLTSTLPFAREKPSWRLACEGLDIRLPFRCLPNRRWKQFNTAASLTLPASVKGKIRFPCCHFSLLCVSKEKGFAYQHKHSPRKMCWWKSFVNSLGQRGLNSIRLSSLTKPGWSLLALIKIKSKGGSYSFTKTYSKRKLSLIIKGQSKTTTHVTLRNQQQNIEIFVYMGILTNSSKRLLSQS